MRPLLSVRDLRIAYKVRSGSVWALRGVDFEIARGEVLGIRGRSGCGKSTLALAVAGALPENASWTGRVDFEGHRIAPVFQEASGALHPMLSIGHQVLSVIESVSDSARSSRKAKACSALNAAGLASDVYFDAWPHQLSGGEKQRALLAQALAADPDLIVADEPTASLDGASTAGILDVLLSLRDAGRSLLLVSHSEAVLGRVARRVLTLEQGLISVAHA